MLRAATASVLLVSVFGCTTVQHVRPATDPVSADPPAILWVTNEHNEAIPVGHPRLAGDSLIGTWVGVGEPVVIHLDPAVKVHRIDGMRTALLGLGLTSGTLLLLMLSGGDGESTGNGMGDMCTGDMDMMDDCM